MMQNVLVQFRIRVCVIPYRFPAVIAFDPIFDLIDPNQHPGRRIVHLLRNQSGSLYRTFKEQKRILRFPLDY